MGEVRLIDANELKRKVMSWLRPVTDEMNMVDADDVAVSVIMEIEEAPTVDPIEYLNSKGFAVTNQVWLDSKPCYTCEENNGYCVSCTKVETWKSKNPLLL